MDKDYHVSYMVTEGNSVRYGDAALTLAKPLTARNFQELRAFIAKEVGVEPPAIIITSLTKLDEASIIEVPHA